MISSTTVLLVVCSAFLLTLSPAYSYTECDETNDNRAIWISGCFMFFCKEYGQRAWWLKNAEPVDGTNLCEDNLEYFIDSTDESLGCERGGEFYDNGFLVSPTPQSSCKEVCLNGTITKIEPRNPDCNNKRKKREFHQVKLHHNHQHKKSVHHKKQHKKSLHRNKRN